MSVIGIDLGCQTAIIAQAQRGGISVLLNEASNRLNKVLVSFNGKERFIGEAAVSQLRSNYKNTITQVKRLLGRKFSEPGVQYEIENFLSFEVVPTADDNIGIKVMYNDAPVIFSPEQVLAMFLTKMGDLVTNATGAKSSDVVLSVPNYFTDAQRHAIIDSCAIANVKLLRLLNDTTAAALTYGMFRSAKGEFSTDTETKVMFVSMGHASFSVCIVGFVQGKFRVISTASEPDAGGRDIDAAMARQWAGEFSTKYSVDAWGNHKARLKLMLAAEKVKKDLSPWGVTSGSTTVECLVGDYDFRGTLDLEAFNALCEPMLAKLDAPLRKALEDADVTIDQLAAVELLGGGMRPRCVKERVARVLGVPGADDGSTGYGLKSTMNMDECVARGCAFASAMMSPLIRVSKTVEIVEPITYPIRVSWDLKNAVADAEATKGMDTAANESKTEDASSLLIFQHGDATPTTKRVTFKTVEPVTVSAAYDSTSFDLGLPQGSHVGLGQFTVSGAPEELVEAVRKDPAQLPRVRVDFKSDVNGIFSLVKAELMKEAKEEETEGGEGGGEKTEGAGGGEATGEAAAAAGDGSGAGAGAGEPTTEGDADKDKKAEEDGAADAAGDKEAKAAEAGKDDASAATEPPQKKKRRYTRIRLDVVPAHTIGMTDDELKGHMNMEAEMAKQDAQIRATQAKRNELETYIYDMRNALSGRLSAYASEADKAALNEQLTTMEDWLYGDGFDTTKTVYQSQLDSLKRGGDPIVFREYEAENRSQAAKAIGDTMEYYKRIAQSTDEVYEHLDDEDRSKMKAIIGETESWLSDQLTAQAALPPTSDPVVKIEDIRQRDQKLRNVCNPIATKKKPPPPTPAAETKTDAEAATDAKPETETEAEAKPEDAPASEEAAAKATEEGAAEGAGEGGEAPAAAAEAAAAPDAPVAAEPMATESD